MITDEELQIIEIRLQQYQNLFVENGRLPHMQRLKQEHCLRVAENSLHIAQDLDQNHKQQNLVKAIGLLHDVGRFQQWKQYATFSDELSVDHGELGATILKETLLIKHLPASIQDLIVHSVRFHNKKDIPTTISSNEFEQLKIIREADRLDIIFVIIKAIEDGDIYDHPQILWNADLYGPATPRVRESLEQGTSINYKYLQTMSDWILLHLQWIEQLYFHGSTQLVQSRNYLGRLQQLMPDTSKETTLCFTHAKAHLQSSL